MSTLTAASTTSARTARADEALPTTMRATVFVAPGRIELREVPRPTAGPG